MAWNWSEYLRSQWLRSWKRPRTVLRGQLQLELFEERNPPSSLISSGPSGGTASGATGSTATQTIAIVNSPSATSAAAPSSTAAIPANSTTAAAQPSSASADTTFSASTSDPFADPLADPLGGSTSKPAAAGGGSSGSGGGSGGGGASDAGATATSPATIPAVLASSGSATDSLWQTLNTLSPTAPATSAATANTTQPPATAPPVTPLLGQKFQTPLSFVTNVGQTDSSVHYLSQNAGFSVFLTDSGLTFRFARPDGSGTSDVLQLQLDGANPHPTLVAQDKLLNRANYFTGGQQFTNVIQYGSITYENVWDGINLTFHSNADNSFEYDVQAAPGADLSQVKLTWQGAQNLSTDAQGNLDIETAGGTIVQNAPQLYQMDGTAKQAVTGSQVLLGNNQVGFTASGYDATKPLVIDPVLGFSSFLGASGNDSAFAVAVAADGSTVVTGQTLSSTFPTTPGVYSSSYAGNGDVFVTRFNPQGQIVFSTIMGGSAPDQGNGVAIDAADNVYIVGTTASSNYPTTAGAAQTTFGTASTDMFVTKLNATGDNLLYSTFLTGGLANTGLAIAVDAQGYAAVTGDRTSAMTAHKQLAILRLAPDGSGILFTDLEGTGTGDSTGNAIALRHDGAIFVSGNTTDANFPTTVGAYQTTRSGTSDAVVVGVQPTGAVLDATFYGGTGTESANGITLLGDQVYIAGSTSSNNLPGTFAAFQSATGGGTDAFVAHFNNALSALPRASYLGGSGTDIAHALAPDSTGGVVVVGSTTSTNFPTANAIYASNAGGTDAFVTHLDSSLVTSSSSNYLGGISTDVATAVGVDAQGNVYVSGYTNSVNYPTQNAYQAINAGGFDAFLTQFVPTPLPPVFTSISPDTGNSSTDQITNSSMITLSGTALANATITLSRSDLGVLPNPVTADSLGHWTYNYASTALSEGAYDFTATQTSGGATSLPTADFVVSVDNTAPVVTAAIPATVYSLSPLVTINASDLIGLPASDTVTLDVDLNNDGSFGGTHETGNATATLIGGFANVALNNITGTGTYRVRARVTDLAGNQGTSATDTFTVASSGASTITTARVQSSDPLTGTPREALGDAQVSHALDLDQSPGTSLGGNPALVYNSAYVKQQPIVQASLQTDNSQALPAHVIAQLTWNNVVQGATTYSTAGYHPGDVLTVAQQSSSTVTTTGRYLWNLQLTLDYGSPVVLTTAGTTFVAAEDNSALGAGWTLSSVNQLVSIGADSTGPAGELMVYGSGGNRFFTQGASTATFNSPAGDNGTLSFNGTNYTYTTPAGDSTTFNSSGLQTAWTSADGKNVLSDTYASGKLSTVTAIDGGASSFTYNGGTGLLDSITTVNSRTYTLTHNGSSNLVGITNPDSGTDSFTYDGNHRVVDEIFANLESKWSYSSYGTLASMTNGNSSSPDVTMLSPSNVQGLGSLVLGLPRGGVTDALGNTDLWQFDDKGRTTLHQAADGGLTTWVRDTNVSDPVGQQGAVTSMTDPLGRTTTYTNDSLGFVTQEAFADSSSISFQYQNAFHALTQSTDELGRNTTYGYDSVGHETITTDANNHSTSSTFDGTTGLLATSTDARGNTTSYYYDADRRLTRTVDALSGSTSFTFDANGNPATTTDALGHTSSTSFDVMGRQVKSTDALTNSSTMTFNAADLPLSDTDPSNVTGKNVYDGDGTARGLLYENVDAASTTLTRDNLTDYDPASRPTNTRDALGNWTTTGYDAVGRTVTVTDAQGNITKTNYDLAGEVTATRDGMGNWTQFYYDTRGRQTSTLDSLGHTTSTGYDLAGHTTITTDALNHSTTTGYDAVGNATITTDSLSHSTTTTYDAANNVLTVTDADGNVTKYTYDALNRRVATTVAYGTGAASTDSMTFDAVGNTTATITASETATMAYNAANWQTSETDAAGNTSNISYNTSGDETATTNPLGKTTIETRDALHRVIQTVDPASDTTTLVLNAADQAVGTIDPLGDEPLALDDSLGQDAIEIDAKGGITRKLYDRGGHLLSLTDPVGNTTHYVYDRDGQLLKTIDPTGAVKTVGYDVNGNATITVDRNGAYITDTFDSANRRTGETWFNSSSVTVNSSTFTYDNANNMLTAADYNGTVSFAFDAQNRVTATKDVYGLTLNYAYDSAGNDTMTTDSLGGSTSMSYNQNNQLTSTKFTDGTATLRADMTYNGNGDASVTTRYKDLAGTQLVGTTTNAYDNARRVTSILSSDSTSTTVASYSYGYDNADRVTSLTTLGSSDTFGYDATNQLVSDTGSASASFSYDANGNRNMAGYTTGTDNRITSDGTYTYMYDAEGNITGKTKGAGQETWYFAYNNRNMLTSVRETTDGMTNEYTANYTYDVLNRRVLEVDWQTGVGSSSTRMGYDKDNTLWADLNTSNAIQMRYLTGVSAQQLIARVDGSGNVSWFLQDKQGSMRDVLNASGVVVDTNQYGAYGNVVSQTSAVNGGRLLYDGQAENVYTGIVESFGRDLLVGIGRWMQQDPIAFDAGLMNLNDYVGNNPTNATDPSGLDDVFDALKKVKITGIETVKGTDVKLEKNTFKFNGGEGKVTVMKDVTTKTKTEDLPKGLLDDDNIQITLTADKNLPADTHWLQFAYRTQVNKKDEEVPGKFSAERIGDQKFENFWVKNGEAGRTVDTGGLPADKFPPYYDITYGLPPFVVRREAKELTIFDKPSYHKITLKSIKTQTTYFDTFLVSEGKVYYHLKWQRVATNKGEKDGKIEWGVEYTGITGEPANKLPAWAQGDTLHGGYLPNEKGDVGKEIVYPNPIPKENR